MELSQVREAFGETSTPEREVVMNSTARHYRLKCQDCEASLVDNGLILECPNEHSPALLISDYNGAGLTFDSEAEGLYRYRRWLPIVRELKGAGRTVTYRSERLSRITELPHLWIAFNGYWPERGAALETATFKELEAYSVLARLTREQPGILVVASAGNTAAAFASACSKNKIACLIIIPESGLHRLHGLLRRNHPRRASLEAGRFHCRRRRQECGPTRRTGDYDVERGGTDRADSRILLSGGGQRVGSDRRARGRKEVDSRRPVRAIIAPPDAEAE